MQDYCGWLASEAGAVSEPLVAETLGGLLAARGHRPDETQSRLAANGGLMAAGQAVHLAEQNGLIACVAGRPVFDEDPAAPTDPARRVIDLWHAHGRDLPQRIHGPFALALIDAREGWTFLAIDRIGIQSLSFAPYRGGLVFSNRADLVAAHPSVNAGIDPQGVFHYFYFFDVPAPGTIFAGVEKLLPAQWVLFRKGTVERGFYWRIRYRDEPRRDLDTQKTRFRQLLHDGVARAKGGDEVAAFLSGGTDSSAVAGVLTEVQGRPARTYSIGFAADGFDEMDYARTAARQFGLDAREYYLTPEDVLATIPLVAERYDEPFANESAVSAYLCARLAADDGFRVMLGGDGGDEIFGGNARYAKQGIFELYGRVPAALRGHLIEPLAAWPAMSRWPPGRKLQSYVRQARIPLPERMESYNFIYRQPLEEMFQADLLAQIDPHRPAQWLKEVYDRADSGHYINRMLHLDLKFTLADNDLRKVSMMAAAAGVEVRYPLLDDAIVAFSGEVPPDWKVKGQTLRWFYKTALRGYLPDTILDKRKHGFGLPFGLWLNNHAGLRERVSDRLADFRNRGWLQPAYIDRIRHEHQTQHATYFGRMIWGILIFEEWLSRHHRERRA